MPGQAHPDAHRPGYCPGYYWNEHKHKWEKENHHRKYNKIFGY